MPEKKICINISALDIPKGKKRLLAPNDPKADFFYLASPITKKFGYTDGRLVITKPFNSAEAAEFGTIVIFAIDDVLHASPVWLSEWSLIPCVSVGDDKVARLSDVKPLGIAVNSCSVAEYENAKAPIACESVPLAYIGHRTNEYRRTQRIAAIY